MRNRQRRTQAFHAARQPIGAAASCVVRSARNPGSWGTESFWPPGASYHRVGRTPGREMEVAVIVTIAVAVGAVLLCACGHVALRRRGRARG
ncbi:hypothetical protein GCM10009730_03810 [Streptomyces albidochromogenes]